jgi:hypothetical protein
MAVLQIKAQSSIRPHSITGKSRLRQRRAITRRPSGNRHEQGRVLNALQGSAAIFMRERDSRDYPVLENMRLQNAFWAWERTTWVVLTIILLSALTGLFAHGPLSERTVGDAGLSLTYERPPTHTPTQMPSSIGHSAESAAPIRAPSPARHW